MSLQEAISGKSVPVYALQKPDNNVKLRFDSGKAGEAALISFVYNLTAARRPKPSFEPERTVYANLRPWKKAAVPDYVVLADSEDLVGAPVIAWDGKKSLQGDAPWGRPIVGTVTEVSANGLAVAVDPKAMELALRQQETRRAALLEKARLKAEASKPEVVALPVPVAAAPPPPPEPEPLFAVGEAVEEDGTIDFDYTGDPFKVNSDGRFVGDDGFVVPGNFDEFYDRYPKYVLNWVKKRLNRFVVDEDVEDWTQDLLIHMKWLPQASKHRMPGANGRPDGCADVVETFNPYQQYGASERRFRNYINFCLANKFNTVQSKRQKNPVCRPGNLAFGITPDEEMTGQGTGDEFIHSNSAALTTAAERLQKQHDDRLYTGEFKRYVRKEDPSVFPAIEALESCGPMGEAAEYMGVTEQEFSRCRARLKQLAECFLKNQRAPKQRKPYKKRAASA